MMRGESTHFKQALNSLLPSEVDFPSLLPKARLTFQCLLRGLPLVLANMRASSAPSTASSVHKWLQHLPLEHWD